VYQKTLEDEQKHQKTIWFHVWSPKGEEKFHIWPPAGAEKFHIWSPKGEEKFHIWSPKGGA